jgi:accessory gene regulator B
MTQIEAFLLSVGIEDRLTLVKIKYGLEILRNEVTKFVILIIAFYISGYLLQFLFATSILLPLRSFAGGLHMRTNIGCFLCSLIVFLLQINILPMLSVSTPILFVILIISSFIVAYTAPIPNKKRPIKTKRRYHTLKIISMVAIVAVDAILMSLFCADHEVFFIIGIWVVVLQALQMLIARINITRKEKGNE